MRQRMVNTVLVLLVGLVGGCAAPALKPVDLPGDFFTGKLSGGRVGVVLSDLPQPDTRFPGADCLLCIGVASMAHSALTTQVRTLGVDELKPLASDLAALLSRRGLDAVAIDEALKVDDLPDLKLADAAGKPKKDFSGLKGRYAVDRVLIVHITSLGVSRSYSAYVPTAPPRAFVYGQAYLVDLATHQLQWMRPIEVSRAADGAWDEPPKFPGLSNAYYQALEAGKDLVKEPFAK